MGDAQGSRNSTGGGEVDETTVIAGAGEDDADVVNGKDAEGEADLEIGSWITLQRMSTEARAIFSGPVASSEWLA